MSGYVDGRANEYRVEGIVVNWRTTRSVAEWVSGCAHEVLLRE